MEFYVNAVYLLLFLNAFSEGVNAESWAIGKQNIYRQSGIIIDKRMPQKPYAIPNMVPKINPVQLNLRLNNVPKIVIPIFHQQQNKLIPNVSAISESDPNMTNNINKALMKELKNSDQHVALAESNDDKNVKTNENVPQIKDAEHKRVSLCNELEQNNLTNSDTNYETSIKTTQQDNMLNDDINLVLDSKNIETIKKSNQGKTAREDLLRIVTDVTQKDRKLIPEQENKRTQPKSNEEKTEFESGRRTYSVDNQETISKPVVNNAKDDIPITFYTLDDIIDRYSKSSDKKQVDQTEVEYTTNQQSNNIVIKNQNVEELCEKSQENNHKYQVEYQPQNSYELPTYETNDYSLNNVYHPRYTGSYKCYEIPSYQGASFIPYPKDTIWRNWKTTEIYISKREPEVKFNNKFDKYNGFNTPIMNADIGYNYSKQKPLYKNYVYPMYMKH